MAYERKTIDTWELQLNYGYGWEYTLTEYTRKEARERLKEYRENQPQYPARLVKNQERSRAVGDHTGWLQLLRADGWQDQIRYLQCRRNRV